MSFLGIVGGFISAAISTIGASAVKVGAMVGSLAQNTVSLIAKIPGIDFAGVSQAVAFVGDVIHMAADFLEIQSEDDPQVLGAKAGQAEKSIEDFDENVEAYIQYLKEEVELDRKKFNEMSEEEKTGCIAVGMALEAKAVEEKIGGIDISPECLAVLAKIHLGSKIKIDAEVLVEVVKSLKDAGITNLSDVADYLQGTGDSDRIRTGEVLKEVLGEGASEKLKQCKMAVRTLEADR